MNILLLFIAFLLIAIVARPRRYDRSAHAARLLSWLPPHRFDNLLPFVTAATEIAGSQFWTTSRGIRGIGSRLIHLTVVIAILQNGVSDGSVKWQDARRVWTLAL